MTQGEKVLQRDNAAKKAAGKKLFWYNLAFMSFTAVWGFGNVINGFSEFGGVRVFFLWILVFALYFVPYSLMVGELGSVFSGESGGVRSWIKQIFGPRLAFFAGWTYFIVHMPYLSQKPSAFLIACGWAYAQSGVVSEWNTTVLQLVSLGVFIIALALALRGLSFIKRISTLAGVCVFVMSMLFVVMAIASPAITGSASIDTTVANYTPDFNPAALANLSILIFAVGGCEKISPYVSQMNNPSKDFPRGMIALAVMVAACALLGTVALGMMFDSNNLPSDLLANGAYYAFQMLGEFYGLGNLLMVVYAVVNALGTFCVLIISIDAPLRMLLDDPDPAFIPSFFQKQNANGVYVGGVKFVGVVVGVLILIPAIGIGDVNALVKWLVKVNSVIMPLRYLWVFVAYIGLKRAADRFSASEYRFVKSRKLGVLVGGWCFAVTAIASLAGIFNGSFFEVVLNIGIAVTFVALGLLMPAVAKRMNKRSTPEEG